MESTRYSAAILDANIGSANVTESKQIQEIVFNTFDVITNLLKKHCGPYSAFALTHTVGDEVSEPVFTNDGINIVRTLHFLNPVQDFARKNIAYIGSRVESRIGDGTTTAMILASSFMKYLSDPKNKEAREVLSHISYSELVTCYNQAKENILHQLYLRMKKVSTNDKAMISKVAYCQAFTSSHGDVELSSAVAKLFGTLEAEAWPYIYYYRESMETTRRYAVRADEDQFATKVTVMNKNMLNSRLGTAYKQDNTDLLVIPDLFTASDALLWNPIEALLRDAIMKQKPLLVLCQDQVDTFTKRSICDVLLEDENHVVTIYFHHSEHPKLNDFRVLTLLTKQVDLSPKFFFVKNVSAACVNHDLVINRLYEEPADLSENNRNPLLQDKNYPLFAQQAEEIRDLIDQAKEESVYRDTSREIMQYVQIYNRLYFRKKWMIVVGGLAYDNSAAMDTLMDTVNAVNRSLKDGYSAGANTEFCEVLFLLQDMATQELKSISKKTDESIGYTSSYIQHALVYYHLINAFLCALKDVYGGIEENVKHASGDPMKMLSECDNPMEKYLEFDSNDGWTLHPLMETIQRTSIGDNNTRVPVLQPYGLLEEVMTRIGEVCLKFLKTENIVSSNGVYTPPPKKKSWRIWPF